MNPAYIISKNISPAHTHDCQSPEDARPARMPPGMRFHSPPKGVSQQRFIRSQPYQRPRPDPAAEAEAAMANELLNRRSRAISHIIAQKTAVGDYSNARIEAPPADTRAEELHKELGIDKVQIVKMPFEIDTTPGGFYKNQALSQSMEGGGKGKLRDSWAPGFRDAVAAGPARADAKEYSANGTAAPAVSGDGRLLRGGWAVN